MSKKNKSVIGSWHVATAAEAIAAAQFARLGWDVSVQYGANQPEYDLIIARDKNILKISVKGSQDGSWGLTQSYKKGKSYHEAIDFWFNKHSAKTVFCLVQFREVEIHELPRIYLATPSEIVVQLKKSSKGRGDSILHENHTWTSKAHGAGTTDKIPLNWIFSENRLTELVTQMNKKD